MQSMKTQNNVNELYNSPNRKYKKDTVTFESSQFYVQKRFSTIANPIEDDDTLTINTIHCRGDYTLIKEVIKKNEWVETK